MTLDPSLPRLQDAIAYALQAHAGQVRKGTAFPNASHLLAVCAIVANLRTHGPAMLSRFNAPPGGTVWFYRALAEVFGRRLPGPLSRDLAAAADELAGLAKE